MQREPDFERNFIKQVWLLLGLGLILVVSVVAVSISADALTALCVVWAGLVAALVGVWIVDQCQRP